MRLTTDRTLEEYFSLPQAPAANSPVGRLMPAVLGKFPAYTFEQARAKANALLDCAAGKRVYRVPPVLSEEEQEARRQSVRARFSGPTCILECPENRVSSVGGLNKMARVVGRGMEITPALETRGLVAPLTAANLEGATR